MSRSTPAAVAPAQVPTSMIDGSKSKRRDSFKDPADKESESSSARGRKYSLTRVPSSRSESSYSRHSPSPEDRRRHRRPRRRSYASDYSRSRSPPRREPRRRSDGYDNHGPEKPWFKKKSIWATVASLASVASVAAVSMSTQATRQSAQATRESAQATKQSANAVQSSARATRESADASNRVARQTVKSTQAAVNTAVASGHQDHYGRYMGPPPREGRPRIRDGSNSTRAGRGHNLLEYHPMATAKV